jgi:hypothetical protein
MSKADQKFGNLVKEHFDRPCFCYARKLFKCLNTQSFCPAALIELQWVDGWRFFNIDEETLKFFVKKIRKNAWGREDFLSYIRGRTLAGK